MVWRFYHGIRDNCDLIEYAESVAQKQASIPHSLKRISILQYSEPATGASVDALIDSLWELPRDTLSTLQMHLLRRREKYSTPQGYALTQREWVTDRLQILQQLDIFGFFGWSVGLGVVGRIPQKARWVVAERALARCCHLRYYARE